MWLVKVIWAVVKGEVNSFIHPPYMEGEFKVQSFLERASTVTSWENYYQLPAGCSAQQRSGTVTKI